MKPSYPISMLTLFMGILLSCVAGYFSIIGLATIFSGAFNSVIVMATALELSKLVAASWIYRNWMIAPIVMKIYMIIAVVVLVGITSMGIFGYLSKAHIDQNVTAGDTSIRIEQLDIRIERQQKVINDAETVIAQLDTAVETLIEYDRIRGDDGAIAVRQSQAEERSQLNSVIDTASDELFELQSKKAELTKEQLIFEAEVGPLKYIAELIYGDEAKNYFDKAVRYIIIIIVVVFDPLAVCLILAGNTGIMHRNIEIKDDERYLSVKEESIMKIDDSVEPQVKPNKNVPKSREGHGLG